MRWFILSCWHSAPCVTMIVDHHGLSKAFCNGRCWPVVEKSARLLYAVLLPVAGHCHPFGAHQIAAVLQDAPHHRRMPAGAVVIRRCALLHWAGCNGVHRFVPWLRGAHLRHSSASSVHRRFHCRCSWWSPRSHPAPKATSFPGSQPSQCPAWFRHLYHRPYSMITRSACRPNRRK